MSQPSGASAPPFPSTVAFPFSRIAPLQPYLFQVNSGVPINDALEQASLLLSATYAMAQEVVLLDGADEGTWAMVYLVEAAKAVVDSVVKATSPAKTASFHSAPAGVGRITEEAQP
jgi:hypothetical protein